MMQRAVLRLPPKAQVDHAVSAQFFRRLEGSLGDATLVIERISVFPSFSPLRAQLLEWVTGLPLSKLRNALAPSLSRTYLGVLFLVCRAGFRTGCDNYEMNPKFQITLTNQVRYGRFRKYGTNVYFSSVIADGIKYAEPSPVVSKKEVGRR